MQSGRDWGQYEEIVNEMAQSGENLLVYKISPHDISGGWGGGGGGGVGWWGLGSDGKVKDIRKHGISCLLYFVLTSA